MRRAEDRKSYPFAVAGAFVEDFCEDFSSRHGDQMGTQVSPKRL